MNQFCIEIIGAGRSDPHLSECADAHAHAAVIESLISGETVASWAVSEPGRGWAPLDPAVRLYGARQVSGRAVKVLRYIDYMAIVCEMEPGPSGALGLQLAAQYVVGLAVFKLAGFRDDA